MRLRRFLWSLAMIPTLGLIYPWMGSSLWRYRWRNSWYGDRRFEMTGNWRAIAGPFYPAYFINALAIIATAGWITSTNDLVAFEGVIIPGPIGLALCAGCVLILAFSIAFYRTRVASRMLSTVSVGDAKLSVKIGTGALFGQFVIYLLALVGVLILLALAALIAIGSIFAAASASGQAPDAETVVSMFSSGTANVVAADRALSDRARCVRHAGGADPQPRPVEASRQRRDDRKAREPARRRGDR